MSDEKEGILPDTEQPDAKPPEQGTPETKSEVLPDHEPEKVDVAKITEEKATISREKEELAERLRQTEEEKALLEKRVKDNQEYISRTRNTEKGERPAKTFEQYETEVLTEFENDPKAGLRRVLRDVAFDRDLERRENEKRIAEAEERAFRKAIAIDPERGKTLKEIEKLDEECPDMKGLSFERKLEFINLRVSATKGKENTARERTNRERDIATDVGGSRVASRSERTPSWLNDPEVEREALAAGFKSKQEILQWSPAKARETYENERRKQSQM